MELNLAVLQPVDVVKFPADIETLFDKLRCSMCKKFPVFTSQVIYSCPVGHISCPMCAEVQQKKLGCTKIRGTNGTCKLPVTSRTNLPFMEYLYGLTEFKCKVKDCQAAVLGKDMEEHVKYCVNKSLRTACPAAGCAQDEQLNPEELWEHIKLNHHDVITDKSELHLNLNYYDENALSCPTEDTQMIFNAVESFGQRFVIVCSDSPKSTLFFGFVMNDAEVARKFYFSFEITRENNEKEWPPCKILSLEELQGRSLKKLEDWIELYKEKKAIFVPKSELKRCENLDKNAPKENEKDEDGNALKNCPIQITIRGK